MTKCLMLLIMKHGFKVHLMYNINREQYWNKIHACKLYILNVTLVMSQVHLKMFNIL